MLNNIHTHCFACGDKNPKSLQLQFSLTEEGGVRCTCTLDQHYQGYPGCLQGGITATILDSAMTNCLFSHNIEAMTARLNVSYRKPIEVGEKMQVCAKIVGQRNRVYELKASITQQKEIKASAVGRFMVSKDAI